MAEGNVGARLTLIGKSTFLAGIREAQKAVEAANAKMAASAKAAADSTVQGYATMAEAQAAYRADLAATSAAQTEAYVAMGRKLALGLGAAGAIMAYEGLKIHAQFQSAMLQSENLAGIAQSRMAALTAGIKDMSPAVNQGLVPLANALYRIASTPAGLKATNAQLLNMVRYSAMLTTIGGPGTDLESTARIMGGALTTGVKGATSPKQIATLAAATVGSGDIRMSDVVDFLGSGALTSAKLTGIPINQMMAFLALAGSNLQSGSVSGHAIAHGLQLMFAPTPAAQEALGAVGLGATTLAQTGRTKGLGAATAQLAAALKAPLRGDADPNSPGLAATLTKFGFTPAQIQQAMTVGLGSMGSEGQSLMNLILTRMFGGAKMGIPLDMLVSEGSNYQGILKHIDKATADPNTLTDAMSRQMDTLSGKTGQFTKSLAVLADTIGTDLTPAAKTFLTVGTDVIGILGKNKAAAGAFAGVLTGILGPAVVLYGIKKMSAMGSAIQDVVKGYALAVRSIIKFIGWLVKDDLALAANDASLDTNTKDQLKNDASRHGGGGGGGILGWVKNHVDDVVDAAPIAAMVGLEAKGLSQLVHGKIWNPLHMPALDQEFHHLPHWVTASPLNSPGRSPNTHLKPAHPLEISPMKPLALGPLGAFGGQQIIHTHVYIDGKEVFTAMQKQTKKIAARN